MASVCWLFISTPMMLVGVWCIFLVQRRCGKLYSLYIHFGPEKQLIEKFPELF